MTTISLAAVIGALVVLGVASTATWLTQRALNRKRTVADSENESFWQWQWLWFAYSVPLTVIAWVIFKVTGLLK